MRISTTVLESYRLFMGADWMSESDLLDTIAGRFKPNRKVLTGQAFGRVLEAPELYRVPGGYLVGVNGHQSMDVVSLGDDVIGPALALIDRPRTVFEAKATKAYGQHEVVAKADQMVGAHLIETKTTLSTFDFDKYAASCQWRFMVDIFQTSKVSYHVFCLDESSTGVIGLRSVESFDLYPYSELHQDCADLVRQFAEYVAAKGLTALLDERQVAAVGAL